MVAPVHRLKKQEIVWLGTHRCQHGHTYLEHFQCYQGHDDRIGFLDIETTGFDADWNDMLCYCILDDQTGEILHDVVTKQDLDDERIGDKKVVRNLVRDIQKFDILVGFYSTKFDVPFARSRAFINHIKFPSFGSIQHKDVYYIIRHKFKLSRNRQETACLSLLGESEKTHLVGKIWKGARRGRKKDIDYILEHCKADVRDLRKLYWRVIEVAYPGTKSI